MFKMFFKKHKSMFIIGFIFFMLSMSACSSAAVAIEETAVPPTTVPPTEIPPTNEALIDAIKAEDVAAVLHLLEAGIDPNIESDGAIPMNMAVARDNFEIFSLLLEHGGDVISSNERLLDLAAKEGEMLIATYLLDQLIAQGWDINAYDSRGATPLFWAASKNQADYVQTLIDAGADIEKPTADNATPLMFASYTGKEDAVRVLVENGASLNYQGMFEHSALHVAAEGNHPAIVKFLIESGAELNLKSSRDLTPLGWALSKNSTESAQILQDAGAVE